MGWPAQRRAYSSRPAARASSRLRGLRSHASGFRMCSLGSTRRTRRRGLEMLRDDPRARRLARLALLDRARGGYAIVLACDMPFVDERALASSSKLRRHAPLLHVGPDAGSPFSLATMPTALPIAATLAAQGVRSLQTLLETTPKHIELRPRPGCRSPRRLGHTRRSGGGSKQ